MAEHRISNMIKNLSSAESEAEAEERFNITAQLNKALAVVEPPNQLLNVDQNVARKLIMDAIYVGHLSCLRYYQINDALAAISRIQASLATMTREMSQRRPRIPLVGIAAGERLMPVAFQSEEEANSYKSAIQTALGNGDQVLHLTPVELSTTVIDNVPVPPPPVLAPMQQKVDHDIKAIEEKLAETLPNPLLKVNKGVPKL